MTTVAPPQISVVVPVLDMADSIDACLDALVSQSLPSHAREIIVVDNGSTDGTAERVARHPVTLLREPAPGAPCARNRGLAAARGAWIAFTDADCVPSRGWLAWLLKAAAAPEVEVVTGSNVVLDAEASIFARYSAALGQYDPRVSLSHPLYPYATTANVAFKRTLLDEVGPFNPQFPIFDAAELFWRIGKRGPLRYRIEPRAVVFYRTRSSISGFIKQNYGYGRGVARFRRLVASERGASQATPSTLRSWRARVAGAGAVARSAGAGSPVRTAGALGLHLLRETALAAGALAAEFE